MPKKSRRKIRKNTRKNTRKNMKRFSKIKKRLSKANRKTRRKKGGAALAPPDEPTGIPPYDQAAVRDGEPTDDDLNLIETIRAMHPDPSRMMMSGPPRADKWITADPESTISPWPWDSDRVAEGYAVGDEIYTQNPRRLTVTDQAIKGIIKVRPDIAPYGIDLRKSIITDDGIALLSKKIKQNIDNGDRAGEAPAYPPATNRRGRRWVDDGTQPEIWVVDLSDTNITDVGLNELVSNLQPQDGAVRERNLPPPSSRYQIVPSRERFGGIIRLFLSNCPGITNKGALDIATYCPLLQEITLNGTNVTIEGVNVLLNECQHLKYIKLPEGLTLHEKKFILYNYADRIISWDWTPRLKDEFIDGNPPDRLAIMPGLEDDEIYQEGEVEHRMQERAEEGPRTLNLDAWPVRPGDAAAAEEPEPKLNYRDTKCFDPITMDDEKIEEHLNEDKNNFILMIGDKYECGSMDYLRQQFKISPEERPDLPQPYYKMWYECIADNQVLSPENVKKFTAYVKLSSSALYVKKPDWIYEGVPPSPRVFKLTKTDTTLTSLTSNDNTEGGLIPDENGDYPDLRNLVSGDHCNTGPQALYELVPILMTGGRR